MFKPKSPLPARLKVFFAREAPVGVIFREGPRKRTRLILWHTDTDTFEPGHWFLGKLQLHDLSPDGKLLVYAASKWHKNHGVYADSWVAISKPPYVTALAFWWTAWGRGQAIFQDNQTLALGRWLAISSELHPDYALAPWLKVTKYPDGIPVSPRGWQVVGEGDEPLYEKPLPIPQGRFFLHSQARQSRSPLYTLYDSQEQTTQNLAAEQAEVDPQGRLILTRDGKLFVAVLDDEGSLTTTELADFNDMAFEALSPPEWATRW